MDTHTIRFVGLSAWEVGTLLTAARSAGLPVPVVSVQKAKEKPTTTQTVVLTAHGANKIQVIKAIREITGLGLKEAKHASEATPCAILADVDPERARQAAKILTDAGGTVEIK